MKTKNSEIEKNKENTSIENEILESFDEGHWLIIKPYYMTSLNARLISIILFAIFLLMLILRTFLTYSSFFLLIPSIGSIISFSISLNINFKICDLSEEFMEKLRSGKINSKDDGENLKKIDNLAQQDVINQENKEDEHEAISGFTTILGYFCLNSATLCLVLYIILVCLHIEGILETTWNLTAIPAYVLFGVALFYWIFILPGYIKNQEYLEVALFFIYLFSSCIFFVMLNSKLDKIYGSSYLSVASVLLFAIGSHLILYLFNFAINKQNEISSHLSILALLIFSLVSIVLISLKLDDQTLGMKFWVPPFVFTIGYLIFMVDQILEYYDCQSTEEQTVSK